MGIKKTLTGSGARKVLGGANFLIYTAVVLAIIVVANVFVNRYFPRRWDLTPSKKYSLSPQTKKIVNGLTRDVTIYDFDREGGSRSRRDLLDNYGADSRRLSVRYIDPDREPSLARQYDAGVADPNIQVIGADLKRSRRLRLEHRAHRGIPLHQASKDVILAHIERLWGHDVTLEQASDG